MNPVTKNYTRITATGNLENQHRPATYDALKVMPNMDYLILGMSGMQFHFLELVVQKVSIVEPLPGTKF